MRPKLSASIITFNEEANIQACIESLAFCDEIVVVDSLSTDKTKEIALTLGAKVIEQTFLGFGPQKQFAQEQCSHDWVLSLDADERVTPELQASILETLENPQYFGYKVNRLSFHLGRWIHHGGWYPDARIRLVHKAHGGWIGGMLHERIEVQGEAGQLKGHLEHFVFRDLSHNVQTNNSYSSISARTLFEEGKRPSLFKLLFKPPGKFIECYFIKRGFLDGLPGFIIAVGAAYSMFLKFAKLWEHHHKQPK